MMCLAWALGLLGFFVMAANAFSADCSPKPDGGRQIKTIRLKGNSFLYVNFNSLRPNYFQPSQEEDFQLYFYTRNADGLIWHQTLDNGQQMFLAMQGGHVTFNGFDPSGNEKPFSIGLHKVAGFHDNRWHFVRINRLGRRFKLSVDERYTSVHNVTRDVQLLAPAAVHLGGSADNSGLTNGHVRRNFVGGLTEIYYARHDPSNFVSLNLLDEIMANVDVGTLNLPNNSGFRRPTLRTTPRPTTRPTPRPTPRPTTRPTPRPTPRLTTRRTLPVSTSPAYATTQRPSYQIRSITFTGRGREVNLRNDFLVQPGSRITFKFSTSRRAGLILFTSNRRSNFLACEIFDGQFHVIYNLGHLSRRITLRRGTASDGRIHSVDIAFYPTFIYFKLDSKTRRIQLRKQEKLPLRLGPISLGGFEQPASLRNIGAKEKYQGCLQDLQLSMRTVDFRFFVDRGNVVRGCPSSPGRGRCPSHNPCHRGRCTDAVGGFVCDCRGTGHQGDRCQHPIRERKPNEERKRPKVIRLNGKTFRLFKLSRLPAHFFQASEQEEIEMTFFTRQPDGLLWHHKLIDSNQIMFVALESGRLAFYIGDGPGQQQRVSIGDGLNDNRWHVLKISRNGKQIHLNLDERHSEHHTMSREFPFSSPKTVVSLGGTDNNYDNTFGRTEKSFVGGLTKVIYTAKSSGRSVPTNIIDLIGTSDENGRINIKMPNPSPTSAPTSTQRPTPTRRLVHPVTRSPAQPRLPAITMTGDNQFLLLKRGFRAQPGVSISFKFQTVAQRGLLIYTSNRHGNFLAVEIFDGHLYFIHNYIADGHNAAVGTARINFSRRVVSDGQLHEVDISFHDDKIFLKLDRELMNKSDFGRRHRPREADDVYIGGFHNPDSLPWQTLARESYKGCLGDLRVYDRPIDFHSLVLDLQQDDLVEKCVAPPSQCLNNDTCVEGRCVDTPKGHVCHCQGTGRRGETCHEPAWTGMFNGSVDYRLSFGPFRREHTNDISFRFRTMARDGLLFQTRSDTDDAFLRAALLDGQIVVTTNLGGRVEEITIGENLNDLAWHTVYIQRHGNQLSALLDGGDYQKKQLPGEGYYLRIDDIFIGGLLKEDLDKLPDVDHYIGYLQNLMMGNLDVLNAVNDLIKGILFTESELPPLVFNDVSFIRRDEQIKLPALGSTSELAVNFLFKTKFPNGTVIFNQGENGEILLVELVDGKVLTKIRSATGNYVELSHPSVSPVNDDHWHSVSLSSHQKASNQFVFTLDLEAMTVDMSGHHDPIDLSGPLYVGGIPADILEEARVSQYVSSMAGFLGCLASFDLGLTRGIEDLYDYAQEQEVSVESACQGSDEDAIKPSDEETGVTDSPGNTSNVTDSPGDTSNVTDTPGDTSNVTDSPGNTSNVTDSPGDTSNVTDTPGNTSNVTDTPGDTSNVTDTPGNTSNVTDTPGDTSNVTESPGDTSNVTDSHGDTSNVTDSHGTADVTYSLETTDVTDSHGITDVTDSLDTTDVTDSHGITDVTDSPGTTNVTDTPGTTDVTDSHVTIDVTDSHVTIDVTDSHVTTDVTDSPVTTDVTDSHVTIDVTDSHVTTDVTDSPVTTYVTDSPVTTYVTDSPVTTYITDSPVTTYVTDSPETTDFTDSPGDTDVTDNLGTTDVTDSPETTDFTDSPGDTDVTDNLGTTDVTDSPETTDFTDSSGDTDVTDTHGMTSNVSESPVDQEQYEASLGHVLGLDANPEKHGVMLYHYPPDKVKDSGSDVIMMTLTTTQEANSLPLKLSSQASGDFILFSVVQGHIRVKYDMNGHGNVMTLSNNNIDITDGLPHIIRFVRINEGSSLFVDGQDTFNTHAHPTGPFDQISDVSIGGTMVNDEIVGGFVGAIAGLHINGEFIFAMDDDSFDIHGLAKPLDNISDLSQSIADGF